MRALLIVGIKLIGILALYWALQHIPAVLYSIAFFLDKPSVDIGYLSPVWQLTAACASFLFALGFGVFLVIRGEVLAIRLPLTESSFLEVPDVKARQLLSLCIIIAGLLIASYALPRFLLEMYALLTSPPQFHAKNMFVRTVYGTVQPVDSALQVALAAIFIFRSGRVVRLVERYGMSPN